MEDRGASQLTFTITAGTRAVVVVPVADSCKVRVNRIALNTSGLNKKYLLKNNKLVLMPSPGAYILEFKK